MSRNAFLGTLLLKTFQVKGVQALFYGQPDVVGRFEVDVEIGVNTLVVREDTGYGNLLGHSKAILSQA